MAALANLTPHLPPAVRVPHGPRGVFVSPGADRSSLPSTQPPSLGFPIAGYQLPFVGYVCSGQDTVHSFYDMNPPNVPAR